MAEREDLMLLPVIILATAAGFAVSRLAGDHLPVAPEKRTPAGREYMRQVKELRNIKKEFLKSEASERSEVEAQGPAEDDRQHEDGHDAV